MSKFKVGQVWKCRNGEEVTVTAYDDADAGYPWEAGGRWYTDEGGCIVDTVCTPYDLVTLVKDVEPPATDAPKPEAEVEQPRPKMKIGQVWRRRDGVEVTITGRSEVAGYPFSAAGCLYTCEGSYRESREKSGFDLLTLVKDADTPQSEAAPVEPPSPAKLEVGKVYARSDGAAVRFVGTKPTLMFGTLFCGDDGFKYYSRGRAFLRTGLALDPTKPLDAAPVFLDTIEPTDLYNMLREVLDRAFLQASEGKGQERHGNGLPFDKQPMQAISALVGPGFCLGQAIKKITEGQNLPLERKVTEMLGAIVYLAGAVIYYEGEGHE